MSILEFVAPVIGLIVLWIFIFTCVFFGVAAVISSSGETKDIFRKTMEALSQIPQPPMF